MSSETNMRDSYFSDGTFRFHSEAWGRESQDPSDMIKIITKNYENKIRFKKTQDNLYWGTGVYRGEYKYIVIVPSSLTSIALSSKVNGTQFSNYSSWILQQVRININIEKGFDFTDWKGKACL